MTIVAVEGKGVVNTFRDFRTELRVSPKLDNPRQAGEKVKITVQENDKKAFDVTLPFGTGPKCAFRVAGGAQAAPKVNRPFLISGPTGGQQANVQNNQGKDGYQTGGVYMSKDKRRHVEPRQQYERSAVLLLEHPRRSDRRQPDLRPRRHPTVEEYRRREAAVRQRASQHRPPGPPRPVDRPEGRPAHDYRLRRRVLLYLRPGVPTGTT